MTTLMPHKKVGCVEEFSKEYDSTLNASLVTDRQLRFLKFGNLMFFTYLSRQIIKMCHVPKEKISRRHTEF